VVGMPRDLASVQPVDAAMDRAAQGCVASLKGCFADLKDPRHENACTPWLFDRVASAV
jgi:hypothetical protein